MNWFRIKINKRGVINVYLFNIEKCFILMVKDYKLKDWLDVYGKLELLILFFFVLFNNWKIGVFKLKEDFLRYKKDVVVC